MAVPASSLMLGVRTRTYAATWLRARTARSDFSAFEKMFTDEMNKDELLEKNKAMHDLWLSTEKLGGILQKADGPALRKGINEAREAGAALRDLKPYVNLTSIEQLASLSYPCTS